MNRHADSYPCPDRRGQAAFTLAELLVVLGIIGALALLTVTAMAHSQPSSDRAGCANNLRRLMLAWQMYADDFSGQLMAHRLAAGQLSWVSGNLDFAPSKPDNTNPVKLTNAIYAAIGPYVNSSLLFRCPADPSTLVIGGVPKLRVRSYSMSDAMGAPASQWNPSYQNMTKVSEIPQPERIYVLLEEHPGSIGDGEIVLPLEYADRIVDYPAAFHFGGANLGMADGHVEYWQWTDSRTMPPVTGMPLALNVPSPGNPDMARLRTAGSYLK